jgi:ATP adenylyltransferase
MSPLAARIQAATRQALAHGALCPIATDTVLIEDAGVRFVVRSVSSLARKDAAMRRAPAVADPLGDYDPGLFVAELGPAHFLLLNKFNLLPGHVLLVTRRFEPQEALLTIADFEALAACLREIDGLGFYNAGAAAGASQPRKHLQLVPVPLAPESADAVPMERVLGTEDELPFDHAFTTLAPLASAAELHAAYRDQLDRVGIGAVAGAQGETHSAPYNLLVRRGWMLAVPRARADCEAIPVNALGFAGSLFVRSGADVERVRALGPMAVLRAVGQPPRRAA